MMLSRLSRVLLVLAVFGLATGCALPARLAVELTATAPPPTLTAAPTPAPAGDARLAARIDQLLTGLAKSDRFSGSSVNHSIYLPPLRR